MEYQVAILSADAVFARMLELEFRMQHLRVLLTEEMSASDSAIVVLLDLDSANPPPVGSYRQMIGFTRDSALLTVDSHRQCSMILHRPFEVRLLRREVFSCLSQDQAEPILYAASKPESHFSGEEKLSLDESKKTLLQGTKEISLTPAEFLILRCLLSHRGTTVSKAELSALIGASATNKIEVYICYLRRKTDSPGGLHLIRTVRGKGYRID